MSDAVEIVTASPEIIEVSTTEIIEVSTPASEIIEVCATEIIKIETFAPEIIEIGTPGPKGADGGGAVDSVNGQAGVVILAADDVGAAAISHSHTDYVPYTGATQNVDLGVNNLLAATINNVRFFGGADGLFFAGAGIGSGVGVGTLHVWEDGVGIGKFAYATRRMTSVGRDAGGYGLGGTFCGYRAGYNESGNNVFMLDGLYRGSQENARLNSMVYGVLNDVSADQFLHLNAALTVKHGINLPAGETYKIGGVPLALGGGSRNIDGGNPYSVYLPSQSFNGGTP